MKKQIIFLLVLSFIFIVNTKAQTTQDSIKQVEEEQRKVEIAMKKAEEEMKKAEIEMKKAEEEIKKAEIEQEREYTNTTLEAAMKKLEEDMKKLEKDIEELLSGTKENRNDSDSKWERDKDDERLGLNYSKKSKDGFSQTELRLGMLDLGVSSYLFDGNLDLPRDLNDLELLYGGSWNINWHIIRNRIYFVRRAASIEYGLTFSWMHYKFANNFLIDRDATNFEITPLVGEYRKNKLRTTFIEIPLMLTLSSNKSKIFVSGGGYAGLLLGSQQRLKTENGSKTKVKDDFNLNKFRYGLEGRLGLGPINIYAQYSLVPLFKQDQGPELYPLNVGLTILGF
jgi:hypothetical protein